MTDHASPTTPTEADEVDLILDVQGLHTVFHAEGGDVHAVDGIDLQVRRGETLCLVGESGSGKSATARSILQVVDRPGSVDGGHMWFKPTPESTPVDLAAMHPKSPKLRQIRGNDIAMIFQEPMSALSPVHTIGNQITEVLTIHQGLKPREARERVIAELERVRIPHPEKRIDSFTFQLSGGMRQRAMIAMALIARPHLLIADEPTTALDVTTQAQVLDLLAELKDDLGMSLIFITHDLGVVAEIADRVAVMRYGHIVETGTVDDIFHNPQHDYTKELLATLPQRSAVFGQAEDPDTSQEVEDPNGEDRTPAETSATLTEPRTSADQDDTPDSTGHDLVQIKNLSMTFNTASGGFFSRSKAKVHALSDVSLDIVRGSTMGLVGESGCGKTTLGRCLMRAYQPTAGELLYQADPDKPAVDLAPLSTKQLLPYRPQIRMIFQDPYGSLNPRMTVNEVITEPLQVMGVGRSEANDRAHAMLERVGLKRSMATRYPHAFSGGERQRIGIARALITNPNLVVADEAVSALDVSVRTQVLELLADLQTELDLTYLFISHDLSVVEKICDRVAVMYFGKMVENRPAEEIFAEPEHGYTKALLSAVPIPDPRLRGTRERITYVPEDHDETVSVA